MNLTLQLKILSFLQFGIWGCWLTTLGSYMFATLKFDGTAIGTIYSSQGIAALFIRCAVKPRPSGRGYKARFSD